MNRKNFFKKLVVGAAAAAVAPSVLVKAPEETIQVNEIQLNQWGFTPKTLATKFDVSEQLIAEWKWESEAYQTLMDAWQKEFNKALERAIWQVK